MTVPDAVIAMIRAAVPAVAVYDGIVPRGVTPPERYAIVYIDDGTREALAACNRSDSATFRWQVTSVAGTREQASWIANSISAATVDATPTADGWFCGQINHVFSERPNNDETVAERPVVFRPDVYDLLATRA